VLKFVIGSLDFLALKCNHKMVGESGLGTEIKNTGILTGTY